MPTYTITDGTPIVSGSLLSAMYGTVDEGDQYFNGKLYCQAWLDALSTDKTKAMQHATKQIERLRFKGMKTVSTQVLEFPRDGETVVPQNIRIACYEEALSLLEGHDPEQEIRNLYNSANQFGPINTNYRNIPKHHVRAGITSITAWNHLLPYLVDFRTFDWERVS